MRSLSVKEGRGRALRPQEMNPYEMRGAWGPGRGGGLRKNPFKKQDLREVSASLGGRSGGGGGGASGKSNGMVVVGGKKVVESAFSAGCRRILERRALNRAAGVRADYSNLR